MTQSEALTLLKMGKNVFLTGSAGSGKTYVLNQYIDFLKERGVEIAITASTGIAATHIGGMTIHSWSGIGIKDNLSKYDLDALEEKQYLWKRFEKVKVLVIDEISMLSAHTLDSIDAVAKLFKRNNEPFGGLQVIFSGDFFQLPPIVKNTPQAAPPKKEESLFDSSDISYEFDHQTQNLTPFAFRARSWIKADLHICYLHEQFRQDDGDLFTILQEIRDGEVSEQTFENLKNRMNLDEKEINELPKLYTHNMDVDSFNLKKLKEIKSDEKNYDMVGAGKDHIVETLKRGCLSPEKFVSKIGALVMFVKNNPVQGYVNGTVGEIVDYDDGYPVVETKEGKKFIAYPESWIVEDQGKKLAEITQIPLKLAWGMTIHKSQGMTIDRAMIDLTKSFVAGQGYVALSRLRSLDGLYLQGFNNQALEVHGEVLEFDKKLKKKSDIYVSKLSKTDEKRIEECLQEFLKKIKAKSPKEAKKLKDKKDKKEKEKENKLSTFEITRDFILGEVPMDKISSERAIGQSTIRNHVEKLLEQKVISLKDLEYLIPKDKDGIKAHKEIIEAFEDLGVWKLKPIREHFKEKYDYDQIYIARLFADWSKLE